MPKKQPVYKTTPSITDEQLAGLRGLLPHIFTEGRVDFEKLHAALGDFGDERPERYSFSWAGKRDAIRILQTPSRATLVPTRKESIDFDKTQNVFIEGDNLEVLKLLYKPYFGQVKMIYIDPPYNTGNDFVYPDNFTDPLDTYLKLTGQKDSDGNLLTSNAETSGRYHSVWLSMMYPRLFLARQLLREDGVIFVSINDNEIHNLRLMMNELFGEENFTGTFTWQSKKGGGSDSGSVVKDQEYIMCFAKEVNANPLSRIPIESEPLDKKDKKGEYRLGRELNKWGSNSRREDRPTMWFPIPGPKGEDVYPIRNDGTEGRWRLGKVGMTKLVNQNDIEFVKRKDGTYIAYEKIRSTDLRLKPYRTWLDSVGTTADGSKAVKELFDDKKIFDFPKPIELLKTLIEMGSTGDGDIILDFFAGSGSTAQAVIEKNLEFDELERNFICIQLPETTSEKSEARKHGYKTISQIGIERLKRVINKIKKERASKLALDEISIYEDLGFKVFKLRESNYRQWEDNEEKDPKAYAKQMEMLADPLVKGWKEEDVIYEVTLKEGFGLNVTVEETEAKGVQKVSDSDKGQSFYICLGDKIKLKDLKTLNLKRDDLFICRDVALDDETAANLSLQCRLKTI